MVKCPYCGREYSDVGIKNHLSETNSIRVGRHGCPYLYSIKYDVIEDYKSMSIRDMITWVSGYHSILNFLMKNIWMKRDTGYLECLHLMDR